MRCAEAFTGVAVEVLVEEDEIAPIRIAREEIGFACAARTVNGTIPVAIRNEDADHAIGDARGESGE